VIKIRLRLPSIDLPMAGASIGLVVLGLLTVYSATTVPGAHEGLWQKQLLWAGLAFGAAWLAVAVPFRVYDSLAWPAYLISVLMLVAVLLFGTTVMGAKRWLDLGPIRFQPSEIAKIATVWVLARHFDHPKLDLRRLRDWLPPLFMVLVPMGLVAEEPDLGTSLAFPVMLVAMYFWAGMPVGQLLLGLSPMVNVVLFFVTGSLWWFAGAFYQKRRIETFLNPGHDPHGAGYQIIQSRIAIGSGGVTGKGYLQGSQKALAFLPMRHTDFIYSVVGEELGLIGSLSVVLLYGLLILRGYRIALIARSRFASLMAVGLVSALFYHIMVNMLMTIGWAPVTGLPLPLLSYGGTALLVNALQIGLLQNVALRIREG
jgi:rod shape determining protein RodA